MDIAWVTRAVAVGRLQKQRAGDGADDQHPERAAIGQPDEEGGEDGQADRQHADGGAGAGGVRRALGQDDAGGEDQPDRDGDEPLLDDAEPARAGQAAAQLGEAEGEEARIGHLEIYFQDRDKNFRKQVEILNFVCFDCGGVKGGPYEPTASIRDNGTLLISATSGSREFQTWSMTWRYSEERFSLIGLDTFWSKSWPEEDGEVFASSSSYNFLTRKGEIVESKGVRTKSDKKPDKEKSESKVDAGEQDESGEADHADGTGDSEEQDPAEFDAVEKRKTCRILKINYLPKLGKVSFDNGDTLAKFECREQKVPGPKKSTGN